MPLTNRSGFTLVETLVSAVLAGVVGLVALLLFTTAQRVAQGTVERVAMESALLRALRLTREWRNLASAGGDLLSVGDTLRYRGVRGRARICDVQATYLVVEWDGTALRRPVAGRDSFFVLLVGDPASPTDDRWGTLGVTSTPSTVTCPGGRSGLRIPTGDLSAHRALGLGVGLPAIWFEIMEWRAYRSGGGMWLGGRSVSGGEGIQPMLGPLQSRGFSATTFGSSGVVVGIELSAGLQTGAEMGAAGGFASHRVGRDSVRWVVVGRSPP